MADYRSNYTGKEIDDGISKAKTAIQEHQKLKTINNQSILGEGNIDIEGGESSKEEISLTIKNNNLIYTTENDNEFFNNINVEIQNDNENIQKQDIISLADKKYSTLLTVKDAEENNGIVLGDIDKVPVFQKNGIYSKKGGFKSIKANVNKDSYKIENVLRKNNIIVKYNDNTEEELEIFYDIVKDNLFDYINNEFWRTKADKAYYLSGTRVVVGNNITAGRVYRIDCKPNTTYTLSAICTKIMRLGCYHENEGEDSFEDIRGTGTSNFNMSKVVENPDSSTALKYRTLSITTGENDNRLIFQFGANDIQAILPTIKLEEGNVATELKEDEKNLEISSICFKTGVKEQDSIALNIIKEKEVV